VTSVDIALGQGWEIKTIFDHSDHPPADVRDDQNLVSDVYNALRDAGKNLWQKTLFIVVYDEHGGLRKVALAESSTCKVTGG
jgi:hypothetical protein